MSWIKTSTQMPPALRMVLVYSNASGFDLAYYGLDVYEPGQNGWRGLGECTSYWLDNEPSHWMELPEEPESL